MRKSLSNLCATALSAALIVGAAAPLAVAQNLLVDEYGNPVRVEPAPRPAVTVDDENGIVLAQTDWRRDRNWRRDGRRDYGRRDFHRRGDNYYFNGHRGYRHHRPGYREFNGWWFPAAAFIAGAIISGTVNQAPVVRSGNAHVQWCYDRYRSYRASDNTFQPYNGPRQQCYSPYS